MNSRAERMPSIAPQRLREIRDRLLVGLVERELPIRLALLAALAGEHLLMVGPPGTAKSLIARRLHKAFADDRYFERLLTRFSVPEELFGPLSIRGLEQDRYERLTDSYLPTASIAFLDEVFKANSAILNSLLTLLNEREFDNGTQRVRTPLVTVIGASNELPEGEELNALFDRFLMRLHVDPVSAEGFAQLLAIKGSVAFDIPDSLKLTTAELQTFQAQAESVLVSPGVFQLLGELRLWCTEQQLMVSDRRWRKVVKLLQTSALSNGRQEVSIWDLWLLPHCLWSNADQRAGIEAWFAQRITGAQTSKPEWLTRIVATWEAKLASDRVEKAHKRNERGELLYQGPNAIETTSPQTRIPRSAATPLKYLAPPGAERQYLRHPSETVSSDNDGKGYTEQELGDLFIPGHNCYFSEWQGRDRFLGNQDNLLFSLKANEPVMATQPIRLVVESRLKQIDDRLAEVGDYQEKLHQRIESVLSDTCSHLWITPDLLETAAEEMRRTAEATEFLKLRLIAVREGYLDLLTSPIAPDFSTSGVATSLQDE